MVIGRKPKAKPDPFLTKTVQTSRFNLVPCNRIQAVQVTMPWHNDAEILHNLMFEKSRYSKRDWAMTVGKPDGRTLMYHAIVAKEIKGTIGTHRIKIDRSGTATMAIVVHTKAWWGQAVFAEVRTALMDHLCQSDLVHRFAGRVLARNISSIYNYNKLGYRMIGHDRQAWLSPMTQEFHDTVYFEFLAADWREKRAEFLE